jgi:hypothetical protein
MVAQVYPYPYTIIRGIQINVQMKKLRIYRSAVKAGPEIIHDANDVLQSNPCSGAGVPSSYPAFEEMMHSYHGGKVIKLTPYDPHLKYLADQVDDDDPPEPAHEWRDHL